MNYKKHTIIFALFIGGIVLSCKDESLYPLPYTSRTYAGYLRMYKQTTSVFDVNNLAGSAFETIFEVVDEKNGDNLESVEFYATFKRGAGITSEVLVKTIPGTDFTAVPEPTYSEYKRATIRVTQAETHAALLLAPPPPAPVPPATTSMWTSGSVGIAYPGSMVAADQVIYRWIMVQKDGKRFTILNPQGTNPLEDTSSAPDVTSAWYGAPSQKTITVRSLIPSSWVGTYSLQQRANWSPAHTVALHQSSYPAYLNQVTFPTQTVTLSIPAGGLSTEREFTVSYRGSNVVMRINLEQTNPNISSAGAATLVGYGFPVGTTNTSPLGTVFVPLRNSTLNCTSVRQFYWITPGSGTFAAPSSAPLLAPGLPQSNIPNRGVYRTDIAGTAPGNTFSIGVDDDCDEYGRLNGYCTWTRRIYLTLTKL